MTAKEKALSLCQQFAWLGVGEEQTKRVTLDLSLSKRCAKLCVSELIKADPENATYYRAVEKVIDQL